MTVREIPPSEWPQFLAEFSSRHRAWLTTVMSEETLRGEPGGGRLRSLTPTLDADRVIGIDVRLEDDAGAHRSLRVKAPSAIRVDEVGPGAERGLEIVDEGGNSTRLRFRSALPPEMLDGLARGELPEE